MGQTLRSVHAFLALVMLVPFVGTVMARASGRSVVLLSDAAVAGDSIYLSDLLPQNVLPGVRGAAEQVLIGISPQAGTTRVLEGAQIADLLGTAAAFRDIEIPQHIVVHRAGSLVTREEVVKAIRAALSQNGLSASVDFRPEDIRLSAVSTSAADPQLEVRRMDFDPALNENRFWLVSRADRGALPFMVTAQLRQTAPTLISSNGIGGSNASGNAPSTPTLANGAPTTARPLLGEAVQRGPAWRFAPGQSLRPAQSLGIALVQPGKPATLRIFSATMQMMLDVVPLDRGALNEKVRVKLPGTGKILQGLVVGSGQLEAKF